MNANPSFDAHKLADAGFGQANKVVSEAAENFQVLTDALVTGIHGLERAQAAVVATGVKALQQQASGVVALTKATDAKEAMELQQQFARQALDAQIATVQALSGLTVAWTDAFKPLQQRYAAFAFPLTQR